MRSICLNATFLKWSCQILNFFFCQRFFRFDKPWEWGFNTGISKYHSFFLTGYRDGKFGILLGSPSLDIFSQDCTTGVTETEHSCSFIKGLTESIVGCLSQYFVWSYCVYLGKNRISSRNHKPKHGELRTSNFESRICERGEHVSLEMIYGD